MDRQAREIVKAASKYGWTLVTQKRHAKLRCSCGEHQVTIPCTAGKGNRSGKNTIAMMESKVQVGACALPKGTIKRR